VNSKISVIWLNYAWLFLLNEFPSLLEITVTRRIINNNHRVIIRSSLKADSIGLRSMSMKPELL